MIVVGQGRVGAALVRLDPQRVQGVDRLQGWEALDQGAGEPVLVATRNDDLPDVLGKVPAHRRRDLVFVQNGMIRPWLAQEGLSSCTRGLLFFAVQARGDAPKPGGTSLFCGPHAAAVADFLQAHDLAAKAVAEPVFAAMELEKLVWNCVFGLLCQALECSVDEVVDQHQSVFEALASELWLLGAKALELAEQPVALRSLADYSRSIPGYRGAVKEWRWRNGWFVELARRQGQFEPSVHAQWLHKAQVSIPKA